MRIASMVLALVIGMAAPAGAQTDSVRPLVDAEWLMANAGQENVVILDIRDNIEGTDLGSEPYIEGAVVAPYASAGWRTEIDGVPGMLPPVDEVAGLIGTLGIDNDDHVAIVQVGRATWRSCRWGGPKVSRQPHCHPGCRHADEPCRTGGALSVSRISGQRSLDAIIMCAVSD